MDKIQQIEKLFYYIVTYSYLILPIAILTTKEKKGIAFSIGIYGAIVCLSLNLFRDWLPRDVKPIFLNSYTLLEYLFFTYLILNSIQNKRIKQIILIFSIGFAIFQIGSYFFNLKDQPLDSISVGVETILLFIYILFFFYDHSKNNKTGYIYNHPTFWLSAGILIYLGGSFFFNILVNYMSNDEIKIFSHYTYIAEIVKNLFFTVAIWKISRQHKVSSIHQSQIPHLDMDMN